ncbi:hypothetical protein O181_114116 [Austropuccinia psidii MF-1]|uniref:Uncharacterized protein n=1 Tax=Austropuccinia psidii MF-1 TaxID=1389203 RepID=A0A9Q3PV23_9BASI|nr:hypothetical protein [Austropuccinia psidii MF-1]
MPHDTAKKNLCKHTQDAQTFLVTPTKGMAYIRGKATKMTVCIDNAQNPLFIDSGPHFSIVARNYLMSLPKLAKAALAYKGKELQGCIREDDFHWDNYQSNSYTP